MQTNELKKAAEEYLKPFWAHLYVRNKLINKDRLPTSYKRDFDLFISGANWHEQTHGTAQSERDRILGLLDGEISQLRQTINMNPEDRIDELMELKEIIYATIR